MPVVMKDEKKYAECVDVLDQLETWTPEIYSAAGLCSPEPKSAKETTPVIGTHSRPDQPASHVPPATPENDPLHGVKIPCFGDQLTCVRLAGQRIYVLGAILKSKDLYTFCTHSVLLTGIQKEIC